MKTCAECARLRKAFADATRLNVEITSLQKAAHSDRRETLEVLKEASLVADQRWQAAKVEFEEHLALHASAPNGSARTG